MTALVAIPKDIRVARREEPPAETKGKGRPVIGSNPMFIPILKA